MLDKQTIEIVKATVPVLESHGTAITTRFYQLLFQRHPELLNIFNHANQKQGRQQTALANTVYAAAVHIDRLEAILPAVMQIAHKHRSLGIQPEHYPIVGENLLQAIQDVLGEAATAEIINAWGKAYEYIAAAFIQTEQRLYQAAGWVDFKNFIVKRKVKESEDVCSFYLEPEDGQPVAPFAPGQYISIKCTGIPGETHEHIRQYSLSDEPGKPFYRISVKRIDALQDKPEGKVSNYLHQHINEGELLAVSAPAGDFTVDLESDEPVVLIAGGIGQTPLLSMLKTLRRQQPNRPVTFLHGLQNSRFHALADEVKALRSASGPFPYFVAYSNPLAEDRLGEHFDKAGFVDLEWLQAVVPDKNADYYICGPQPMMQAVYRALRTWGVAPERIHYEFFGPKGMIES